MADRSSAASWLALASIAELRRQSIIELVRRVGSAPAVFRAGRKTLCQLGLDPPAAQAIERFSQWDRVEIELARMAKAAASLLPWDSPLYPPLLKHIHDPPPWIVVKGERGLGKPAVAVVGARRASPYGLEVAETLAAGLVRAGVVVISGLARGIDGAAHGGCLREGGETVAVLGSGVDVIYPPEHEALARQVADHGCLVSEFPMGTPPRPSHFPSRNRIIAGMALAVVVVEAGERSGALITASMALENGREVFAVPGRIDSPLSQGTNALIKEGAVLLTSASEILTHVAPALSSPLASRESEAGGRRASGDPVLEVFNAGPVTVDQFIEASGMEASKAAVKLLELELAGLLVKVSGERFELRKRR